MDALVTGRLRLFAPGALPVWETMELGSSGRGLDFLGINYYGRRLGSFSWKPPFLQIEEGPGTKSDLGWEIYPAGLTTVLKEAWDRYQIPLMVSENGLADESDQLRSDFLKSHIEAMREAQRAGVPIFGYLYWSLTDNFEWAKGLKPRFGLVAMDYESQKRSLRPSFQTYKEIIRELSGPSQTSIRP